MALAVVFRCKKTKTPRAVTSFGEPMDSKNLKSVVETWYESTVYRERATFPAGVGIYRKQPKTLFGSKEGRMMAKGKRKRRVRDDYRS